MIDLGGDVCGNGISKLVFTILSAVAENVHQVDNPLLWHRIVFQKVALLKMPRHAIISS
jgi:hypothetical protein